jgi:hypothetical protein
MNNVYKFKSYNMDMNNFYKPVSNEEIKSSKKTLSKKLNDFLKKGKKSHLREIFNRKDQIREKAIESFGDIKFNKLTYSKSVYIPDQCFVLSEKQRVFLKENKDEILDVLNLIKNVNGMPLDKNEMQEELFDMTDVNNTLLEHLGYTTTKLIRTLSVPTGFVVGFGVSAGILYYTKDFSVRIEAENLFRLLALSGGFCCFGGISTLGKKIDGSSYLTKRANTIKNTNNLFIDAFVYSDEVALKLFK